MTTVTTFLAAHWGTILIVGSYVALAFLNNMPAPGVKMTPYEYLYNVKQTLMNAPVIQRFEQKFGPQPPVPLTLSEINKLPQGEAK